MIAMPSEICSVVSKKRNRPRRDFFFGCCVCRSVAFVSSATSAFVAFASFIFSSAFVLFSAFSFLSSFVLFSGFSAFLAYINNPPLKTISITAFSVAEISFG